MNEKNAPATRPLHLRAGALAPLLTLLLLALALAGCGSRAEEQFSKIEPELLAPEDGEVFSNMPRIANLTWRKVEGATRYQVEVQMQNPLTGEWMPTPMNLNRRMVENESLWITFPGTQPGRWRVTAISAKGTRSRATDWRKFEFVKSTNMPQPQGQPSPEESKSPPAG